jgi:hypothetical protein
MPRLEDGDQATTPPPEASGTIFDLFFGSWEAFLFGGMPEMVRGERYGIDKLMVSDYYYEESDPDKRRDEYLRRAYDLTKEERYRAWRDEYIRTQGHTPEEDDVEYDDTDDETDTDEDEDPPAQGFDFSTLLFMMMMMGGGLGATQTDGGMQDIMMMMMMLGGGGLGAQSLFGM